MAENGYLNGISPCLHFSVFIFHYSLFILNYPLSIIHYPFFLNHKKQTVKRFTSVLDG
jgi:hypothetical protein